MYSHLLVERKSFLVFSQKKKRNGGKKTKQLGVKQQTFVGCQR